MIAGYDFQQIVKRMGLSTGSTSKYMNLVKEYLPYYAKQTRNTELASMLQRMLGKAASVTASLSDPISSIFASEDDIDFLRELPDYGDAVATGDATDEVDPENLVVEIASAEGPREVETINPEARTVELTNQILNPNPNAKFGEVTADKEPFSSDVFKIFKEYKKKFGSDSTQPVNVSNIESDMMCDPQLIAEKKEILAEDLENISEAEDSLLNSAVADGFEQELGAALAECMEDEAEYNPSYKPVGSIDKVKVSEVLNVFDDDYTGVASLEQEVSPTEKEEILQQTMKEAFDSDDVVYDERLDKVFSFNSMNQDATDEVLEDIQDEVEFEGDIENLQEEKDVIEELE